MSRSRFTLLLVLLAVVVGAGSFVAANAAFDDDSADAPPRRSGDGTTPEGSSSTTTTATTAPTVESGALPSPSWILIVSSDAPDEAGAAAIAQEIAADGHASGVFRSDDYPSLNDGFWVAYAGPYPDRDAAEAAKPELAADGWTGAYTRCAGTVADCRGDDAGGGNDDSED